MKFGQQIKWLDSQNKQHMGTVVARGNEQNTLWGVTHILNPDQTTKPECFVSNHNGTWKICNQGGSTGAAQVAYSDPNLINKGTRNLYASQVVNNSVPVMGLGVMVYQEQYKRQRIVK